MENNRILVLYFSRAGENYAVGRIEKGNTRIVAEMIAEQTGGRLFEIEPAVPYPDDYDECTAVAKREKSCGARPEIAADMDIAEYDTVFVGYPNWWGDMPMAVYTFIGRHDWHGKRVIPFCTHEGSCLSGTERLLAAACDGAVLGRGLAVTGSAAQNSREQVRSSVVSWLESNNF